MPVIAIRDYPGGSKRTLSARRLMMQSLGRLVRADEAVVTTCGDPLCLAPRHLLARKRSQIVRKATARTRGFNPRKLAANRRKAHVTLTMEKARAVRARYTEIGNAAAVAREFGISPQRAWAIATNLAWREPPMFPD